MEGLCLPVFKLLQKTPRGKRQQKGTVSSIAWAWKGEGWPIASARPPASCLLGGLHGVLPLSPPPPPLLAGWQPRPAGRLVNTLSELEGF